MTEKTRIQLDTGQYSIEEAMDPITCLCWVDFPEYIQKIKKDGWTLDEVKQMILERTEYDNDFYVSRVLSNNRFKSNVYGRRVLKWLSRAVAYNLFSANVIHDFSRSENLKDWIRVARKAIRSVKSFDDLAKLYTDNKIHEPLISAYVAYAVRRIQP